jgi:lauroyl/myristoyl acyltransferase
MKYFWLDVLAFFLAMVLALLPWACLLALGMILGRLWMGAA